MSDFHWRAQLAASLRAWFGVGDAAARFVHAKNVLGHVVPNEVVKVGVCSTTWIGEVLNDRKLTVIGKHDQKKNTLKNIILGEYLYHIIIPGPSKGCQMVAFNGCQFSMP